MTIAPTAGPTQPLLTPGVTYVWRLVDGYEFEGLLDHAEDATIAGRPGALVVMRGDEPVWVNINAVALVWERPEPF